VRIARLATLGCAAFLTGCHQSAEAIEVDRLVGANMEIPSCAMKKGFIENTWKAPLTGLDSRQASYRVDQSCIDAWWSLIRKDSRYTCEVGVEYAECSIGKPALQQAGVMLMPRDKDVSILIRGDPYLKAKNR
jgi:hypothetical protein